MLTLIDKRRVLRLLEFSTAIIAAMSLTLTSACNPGPISPSPTAPPSPATTSPTQVQASPTPRPSPYVILPTPSLPSSPTPSPSIIPIITKLPAGSAPVLLEPYFEPSVSFLTWVPVSEATEYRITIATDPDLKNTVSGTPADTKGTSFHTTGLENRKTYYWSVSVSAPTESAPATGKFKVDLSVPHPPPDFINLLSPNIREPVNSDLVTFSWDPFSGATEYEIIIATDAALTKTVAGTPVKVQGTSCQVANLDYSTQYFWALKATKPQESIQTIGIITTAPRPTP